jgi:hypothetical protein
LTTSKAGITLPGTDIETMKSIILLACSALTSFTLLAGSPPVAVPEVVNAVDIAPVLHDVNGYWHYVITPNEGGGSILFDASGSYDPDGSALQFCWGTVHTSNHVPVAGTFLPFAGLPCPGPANTSIGIGFTPLNAGAAQLSLALVATDGIDSSPVTAFGVIVFAPSAVLYEMGQTLDYLARSQPVPTTVNRSLRESLSNAAEALKAGDTAQALHYIKLFQNRIKSQPKFLDEATRQGLIDVSEAVVAIVTDE